MPCHMQLIPTLIARCGSLNSVIRAAQEDLTMPLHDYRYLSVALNSAITLVDQMITFSIHIMTALAPTSARRLPLLGPAAVVAALGGASAILVAVAMWQSAPLSAARWGRSYARRRTAL